MKNKEIEELLNNIKDKYSYDPYDTTGKVYTTISYEEGQLLLSYIEQLEKRNKELYEGFMATQEELTDYATKNEQLEKENKILRENAEHNDKVVDKVNWENQQLKKQKVDVVEYIKSYNLPKDLGHLGEAPISIRELREILRMLGEIE